MQITTEQRDVNVQGMQNRRSFTVKAGAHIMQVLSGLYKDPVDAMVREYMTNMYDAYLALRRKDPNAKIIPPTLKLPTKIDTNLSFIDYGVGMSMDTVWNVYATYGESTKNGSNDEVGGFGLGSKTAFCYNDGSSWTIESRFNGEKYMFAAFIGADSVPDLTHVATIPTTEHNGVTVSIPILHRDFAAVHTAVQKYAKYFPMELNIDGGKKVDRMTYEYSETDVWGIEKVETGNHYYGGGSNNQNITVVMGNVPYTAELHYFIHDFSYANQNFIKRNAHNITVFVPVGSVDIVPSRDNLKYTKNTISVVAARLKKMLDSIMDMFTQRIVANPTYFSACVFAKRHEHFGLDFSDVKYNDKPLNLFSASLSIKSIQTKFPSASLRIMELKSSSSARYEASTGEEILVGVSEYKNTNNHYIIDDVGFTDVDKFAKSVLHTRNINRDSHTNRATRYGHRTGSVFVVFGEKISKDEMSEMMQGVPSDWFEYASDIKDLQKTPRKVIGPLKESCYKLKADGTWEARARMPKTGTEYFVKLVKSPSTSKYVYRLTDNKLYSELLFELAGWLSPDKTVWGIREGDVAGLDKNVFHNVETMIQANLVDQVTSNKVAIINSSVRFSNTQEKLYQFIELVISENPNSTIPKDMLAYFKLVHDIKTSSQNAPSVKNLESKIIRAEKLFGTKSHFDAAKKIIDDKSIQPLVDAAVTDLMNRNQVLVLLLEGAERSYYYDTQLKAKFKKYMKVVLDNHLNT